MEQCEAWIQVTSGDGPVECAWAVVQVVEKLVSEAETSGFRCVTLRVEPGQQGGTARSVLLELSGDVPLI